VVFVFYQFVTPPLFFNTVDAEKARMSRQGEQYRLIETEYRAACKEKSGIVSDLVKARRLGDNGKLDLAIKNLKAVEQRVSDLKKEGVAVLAKSTGNPNVSDTNYIFLNFVIHFLPIGLVGLVIAAIMAAAMSSISAELNALASATVVDVYKRLLKPNKSERHYLVVSRVSTVIWGLFAILFAQYANRLGTLIEAVNILGSLFYGTILGIFLTAFYLKKVGGNAVFYAALLAECGVIICFLFTSISFLWYNVVGCLLVILFSAPIECLLKSKRHVPR
jgi:Na+(H+)/acetate symporter ActP